MQIITDVPSNILTDFPLNDFMSYPGRDIPTLTESQQNVLNKLMSEDVFSIDGGDDTTTEEELSSDEEIVSEEERLPQRLSPVQEERPRSAPISISDESVHEVVIRTPPKISSPQLLTPPTRYPPSTLLTQDTILTQITPALSMRLNTHEQVHLLKEELSVLKQRVARSEKMESLIDRLKGNKNNVEMKGKIITFARIKYGINLTANDFNNFSEEEVVEIYDIIRQIESKQKHSVYIATMFVALVNFVELTCTKFVMNIEGFSRVFLYDDVANDIDEIISTYMPASSAINTGSPVTRIVMHAAMKIFELKYGRAR